MENAPNILDAWRSGLRERGWIEGKNLLVEYRYTQPTDRYPALAAELTALTPDLVVAAGPQAAVALKSRAGGYVDKILKGTKPSERDIRSRQVRDLR